MNANIVHILSWGNPIKSSVALVSVNVLIWLSLRQRPFALIPLTILSFYVRNTLSHRISREVLVDPPDHEGWITLQAYDFQHGAVSFLHKSFDAWLSLRQTNHFLWAALTAWMLIILAKIGLDTNIFSILFIVANAAFVFIPLREYLAKAALEMDAKDQQQQQSMASSSSHVSPVSTAPTRAYYSYTYLMENFSTKFRPLLAATIASVIALQLHPPPPPEEAEASFHETSELESLSPSSPIMPSPAEILDGGETESEDEFLFDPQHFKQSSSSASSSPSNSFEIVDSFMDDRI